MDLVHSESYRIAKFAMSKGEYSPEHFHSKASEIIVCLSGAIEVKNNSSQEAVKLVPGDIYNVSSLDRHFLINIAEEKSEYLIVQIGEYDYVTINSKQSK